jgi:hypothetical protein
VEHIFEDAHQHSRHNRSTLGEDQLCGCFHCLRIFNPNEIDEWLDHDTTAVCPYCGIDSIIGEGSGNILTKAFLQEMHNRWF